MSAPIALLDATAQSGGPAIANVVERFPLLARQNRIPASQKIALMGAEDIGQFGPMRFHLWIGRRSRAGSESRGLTVERTATSATCR